jgi:hypothetical protein
MAVMAGDMSGTHPSLPDLMNTLPAFACRILRFDAMEDMTMMLLIVYWNQALFILTSANM